MQLRHLVLGAFVVLPIAIACGSSGSSQCCPIDPAPSCCMRYGGHGLTCGTTCDGMPKPSDPGWKVVKDDVGCDLWVNASSTNYNGLCGAVTIDAGACCPIDPSPGCCMHYGGWSASGVDGGPCGATCDGMPLPGDPSWTKSTDSHGCEMWSSMPGGPVCGGAFDASTDVQPD